MLKTRSESAWVGILRACRVQPAIANLWASAFAEQMRGGALNLGEDELDDFLGQVLHESKYLERREEGLRYTTPGRLGEVWPSRFPTLESERPYLNNPEALAEKVYGGRLGNVHEGDGWRYRGRGPIQITGRDNYTRVGMAIGVDLAGDPDQLLTPAVGLKATVRWWEQTLPDSVIGNLVAVTKRVNGGTTGIAERDRITKAARAALNAA